MKISSWLTNLFYSKKINKYQNGNFMLPFDVPYYSQRIDEKWEEMGFPSAEEARFWQWESCGIACLQMIIGGLTKNNPPNLYNLIMEVKKSGGYDRELGWIHKKLADSLKKYKIKAFCRGGVRAETIASLINKKKMIIASIGVGFENKKRKGHLIVIIGYTIKDGKISGFILHHPSARKEYEWPHYFVNIDKFNNHFSGNIIACG